MAFLGIFSKRDKSKNQDAATEHTSSAASDLDPSEPDYVLPSVVHSPPNSFYAVPGASSSKLKLGFKAKKPLVAARTDSNYLSPPSSAFQSIRSESENNLLSPPPPRSAVFAGYADPGSAQSTRSLPTHPAGHARSNSKESYYPPGAGSPTAPPQKNGKGGFFSWANRERKKSKPPPLPKSPPASAPLPAISLDTDSFNLRSFRHVGPESPSESPSAAMLPPVRPRPREGSFASVDSSQRISVAAFREAQARRSTAASPVPSFNHDGQSPGTSGGLRPPSSFAMRKSRSISGDSDTDESDDSGASSTLKPRRTNTTKSSASPATGPSKKAASELGHKASPRPAPRVASSASTNPTLASNVLAPGESQFSRPRASASTSALQPNAAARRASVLAAQQNHRPKPATSATLPPPKAQSIYRHSSSSSTSSSDSSASDSDDAPLATLVGPKRPGSAASSARSSSRPRMPSKPLIDMSGIAPPTPAMPASSPPPMKESPPSPPVARPGHGSKPSINDRLARLAKSAANEREERENAKTRRTPTRSQTQPLEPIARPPSASPVPSPLPSPAHAQTRKPNARSMSSPNATFDDARATAQGFAPIVPTPIRTRTPPPSFAVTSRPPSQLSIAPGGGGGSQSPTPGPRASEETVRVGRQRASTLISDSEAASSRGFTGGGLLAGVTSASASLSSSSTSPVSSFASGPGRPRQRAGTVASSSASSSPLPSPIAPTSGASASARSSPASARDLPPPRLVTSHSSSYDKGRMTASASSPSPASSSRPTLMPKSALKSSTSSSPSTARTTFAAPSKPFAEPRNGAGLRGNSPASSTGDSSSGRTPITPVDGSDIGSSAAAEAAAKRRAHRKSSSVTFEDERGRTALCEREREKAEASDPGESRRRERRRSEAKAAIELGKIVNGKGPIATDDDEDVALSQMGPRMSMMNPLMTPAMGPMGAINVTPPTPMTWTPQTPQGMMNPMFPMGGPPPPNTDPSFIAAHQAAMMAAKQAFQMAFAQQALAAANEEWERGSSASTAFGGAGGMGMGPAFGMNMGMPGMVPWQMPMFPATSQSVYAPSVAGGSEIGGPTARAGWGSRSAYGDRGGYTGSAAERASMAMRNSQFFPGMGMGMGGGMNMGGMGGGGFSGARSEVAGPTSRGARPRTKTNPSDSPLPSPSGKRGGPPPSSWNTRGGRP